MGKSAPSAPAAPDPTIAANAQGAANLETAIGQGWLNALNQYGPNGSVVYNQVGTHRVGERDVPQFSQTTTLSPEQQRLSDMLNQLQGRALGLGGDVLGNVENSIRQPFPGADSFGAERDKATQDLIARNQPQMDRQRSTLETQLANQGIMAGSKAYQAKMDDLGRQENDFRLSAVNAGGAEQNRMFGLATAARSQPINEYATLLGLGGQVQQPNVQGFQAPQLGQTDVIGPMNTQYQGQLANWNAGNASRNSTMGGLFGLGGAGLGGWASNGFAMSDIRLKTDIHYVGNENGHRIYHFRYKSHPDAVMRGVLAQDILRTNPEAVERIGDYYAVDYGMLGVEMARVH